MTKEAQEIFDALTRTLPTRWDGTSIVVMDAVVISSPYRVEDCRAVAGQQASALARVKKVVCAPIRYSLTIMFFLLPISSFGGLKSPFTSLQHLIGKDELTKFLASGGNM